MPRKTKFDIIGLSLLRNDVDCRHFKGAALTVGLPAGPGRILGFWAFAVDRGRAWPVIRLWRPGFTGPGWAGFKS